MFDPCLIKEMAKQNTNKERLLILAEFREEMGSFRNKVAKRLNEEFEYDKSNKEGNLYCFTSDIGMAIRFKSDPSPANRQSKIQCSVCSHDNNLYPPVKESEFRAIPYPKEAFHLPKEMHEVCIKGESEGIFYLCDNHITGPKSLFIERMNQFDLFSGKGISL